MSKKNKEKKNVQVNGTAENEVKEGYVQRLEGEIEEAVVKDPLFSFLKKWSNFIFWICIFLALGFLGYQKYQQVSESSRAEYADTFNRLREHYSNLLNLKKSIEEKKLEIDQAKEKKEDIENKEKDLQDLQKDYDASLVIANEAIKSILDGKDYKNLAKFYSALLYKLKGENKKFREELGSFNCKDFDIQKNNESAFYAEFCALILAKDDIENGKLETAKESLVKICEKGKYFNLIAYKTLSSVLSSDDNELLNNLKSTIVGLHPALKDSL